MELSERIKLLIHEYGDLHAVYANVCNQIKTAGSDDVLLAIKSYIERRFVLDTMEEYGWEQTDEGKWRYITNEEFFARCRQHRELRKNAPKDDQGEQCRKNDVMIRACGSYLIQKHKKALEELAK